MVVWQDTELTPPPLYLLDIHRHQRSHVNKHWTLSEYKPIKCSELRKSSRILSPSYSTWTKRKFLSFLFHIDTVTYNHDSEHCEDSIILIFIEFLCLQKTSYRRPRQCGRRQMGPTSCMLRSMTPRFESWHFHGSDLAPLAVPSKGVLVCGRRSQSPEQFATLR
jgi:hypothetical protein